MRSTAHSHAGLTPSEIAAYYAARTKVRQRGREWRGPCPIHNGKDDNFAVNAEQGTWYCHSVCGRGGSIFDLEMALTKADFPTSVYEVGRIIGRLDLRPLQPQPEMKWGLPGWQHKYLQKRIEMVESENGWKQNATYAYFQTDGRLAYVKVRFTDTQNNKASHQYAP